MKITYLDHSGFAVEYKKYVLIFDWYKGKLPEFDSEKEIYPLRDALQDSYMALLLQEAVMSEGCKIHSQPMPWN